MILYHGTSTEYLDAILRDGLSPRVLTGRPSNFEGPVESRAHLVYLTDAYPVYFAVGATRDGFDLLLLKVEVSEAELFPDEDFVAHVLATKTGEKQLDLIPQVDPRDYQPNWRQSLQFTGTVSAPSIPAAAVLEHRVISAKDFELILAIGGDSMPTVLNYRFMGQSYRSCIETFFADGRDAALLVARKLFREGF